MSLPSIRNPSDAILYACPYAIAQPTAMPVTTVTTNPATTAVFNLVSENIGYKKLNNKPKNVTLTAFPTIAPVN